MSGQRLACDACDAFFPVRPVEGRYWDIRTAAMSAGWSCGDAGDYCPEHADIKLCVWCPDRVEFIRGIWIHVLRDHQGRRYDACEWDMQTMYAEPRC